MTKDLSSPPAGQQAKSLPARISGRLRSELGQAMVEMVFVVPIFLFLLGGVVAVADALNSYITVVDVSRDGARLGSKGLASDSDIQNMVTVEMGRLRDTFNVTITHNQISGNAAIQVKVCSNHSLLLPSIATTFLTNPLPLCATTSMRTITYQ